METENRKLITEAYEKARKDPANVGALPPWDDLSVDMKCALVTVFHAGANTALDRLVKTI